MTAAATRTIARLDQASTVLFVCDVQERFAKAIYGFDRMVDASVKLLRGASTLNVPVFATEQNPKALGATVSALTAHFPKEAVTLPKTRFSMCLPSGETFDFLSKHKAKSVMIVGIESHVCVLQTTLELLAKGYDVFVIRDAISSCNREEISTAVERMRQAGATVTSSESALFELMLDAGHPNFKTISGLIKEEKERTKASLETLVPAARH